MSTDLTRRELIGAGAAGVTLLATGGCDADDMPAARTTAAPPARAMNVVVVVMDSLRVDHVYGSRARTASWNKVAGQGLRFVNAYPEGMPTIPARRAIMAGRRTFPFRGWKPRWDDLPPQPGWEPVGSDGEMWTQVLQRNGWTTGYVTDNPHLLLGVHRRFRAKFDRFGLVDGQVPVRRAPKRKPANRVVEHYLPSSMRDSRAEPRMAAYLAVNPRHRREEDYNAAKVFRHGMDWIAWAKNRQPFALVVDSFDAHEPWDAPRRLVDLYGPPTPNGVEPIQPFATPAGEWRELGLSQGLLRRMRQLYAAEVTLVDVWLGKFLDRLADLGLEQNTLLVLVSDHGVLLGEYGWVGKRFTEMHQELTHVPLVIRHPDGRGKGRTSRYYASTHDIGPTVLSLVGVDRAETMNGVDLSPILRGKRPSKKRGYRTASYSTYVSAGDDRWLLIAGNQRQELRLYDRRRDPREIRNIAAQNPGQVKRMWGLIKHDAGPKGLPKFKV
ncbi:MAG TPA: sulfatase [Thermoleophilaceae bacterium]|nr:sulfatase [Thermoleophilaceae bacterium]